MQDILSEMTEPAFDPRWKPWPHDSRSVMGDGRHIAAFVTAEDAQRACDAVNAAAATPDLLHQVTEVDQWRNLTAGIAKRTLEQFGEVKSDQIKLEVAIEALEFLAQMQTPAGERYAAENARLRAALEAMVKDCDQCDDGEIEYQPGGIEGYDGAGNACFVTVECVRCGPARAALAGGKGEGRSDETRLDPARSAGDAYYCRDDRSLRVGFVSPCAACSSSGAKSGGGFAQEVGT